MLVNISGNRCISCAKFTQYYALRHEGEYQRIDCGFCGQRQRTTKPGSRCKHYREVSNLVGFYQVKKADDGQDSA